MPEEEKEEKLPIKRTLEPYLEAARVYPLNQSLYEKVTYRCPRCGKTLNLPEGSYLCKECKVMMVRG